MKKKDIIKIEQVVLATILKSGCLKGIKRLP